MSLLLPSFKYFAFKDFTDSQRSTYHNVRVVSHNFKTKMSLIFHNWLLYAVDLGSN